MSDIKRFKVGDRMSQVVLYGNTVYTAGQVAKSAPSTSIAEQTRAILSEIDELLHEAGTNKSKLISANIWLSDISDFNEMNEVWDAWVSKGQTPCRACVESKLAAPEFSVEISVIAAV